jgi:hypothetical protein
MGFPALGANSTMQPLGSARDAIPISASTTLNIFGETFNNTNGPQSAARCCEAIMASATTTFSGVTAAGNSRSGLIVQGGITPIKLIQVTAISGGSLWALI